MTLTLTKQTIHLEPGLIRIRTGRNGERKITFDFMKSHNHKGNVYDYFYVGEDLAKGQRLISEEGNKGLKKNASSVYLGLVFNIHWLFWWHQQGSKAFKLCYSNSDLVLCSHVKNNIACSRG